MRLEQCPDVCMDTAIEKGSLRGISPMVVVKTFSLKFLIFVSVLISVFLKDAAHKR